MDVGSPFSLAFLAETRRGTRLIGADSFPRISKPCFPRASRAFDVALPDRRASFSSFVSSMPYPDAEAGSGIIPDPARSKAANFWNGKSRKHFPRMGTLLRIDAPLFVRATRSGRPIDGAAPTEPRIGYGSTHRSIFPESQFGTDTRSIFQEAGWGEVQTGSIPLLIVERAGAWGQSGLDRHEIGVTKTFRVIEDGDHFWKHTVNRDLLRLRHRERRIFGVSCLKQFHGFRCFGRIGHWLR